MGKTAVLLCRLTTYGTRHKHRKHCGNRDSSHGPLLGHQTLPATAGTQRRKPRHNNGTQAPRSLALIREFVGELSQGCIHQHYTLLCTRGGHQTAFASMCAFTLHHWSWKSLLSCEGKCIHQVPGYNTQI